MPGLITCSKCSELIKPVERFCPFCDATVATAAKPLVRTAGALAVTAALSGCAGDDSNTTIGTTLDEPAYGVPATETFDPTTDSSASATSTTGGETGETDATASTSAGTETGTDSGSTSGADTGSTSIEPDYGVPDTGG